MTYLELYHGSTDEVNLNTPHSAVTATKALGWMTEAMNYYQIKTKVIRERCDIDLDPTDDDGIIDIGCDVMEIIKIDYFGSDDDDNPGVPVNLVDYDNFVRRKQHNQPVAGTSVILSGAQEVLPGSRPSNIYCARYGDSKLWIDPAGMSGVLKLYVIPYFLPYTPSAQGRWKPFGFPPDELMSSRHIPKEFNSVWNNIRGYVIDKMLGAIDPTGRVYGRRREEAKLDFQLGYDMLTSSHAPRNIDARLRPKLGPVM